jgi:hypothetical protein
MVAHKVPPFRCRLVAFASLSPLVRACGHRGAPPFPFPPHEGEKREEWRLQRKTRTPIGYIGENINLNNRPVITKVMTPKTNLCAVSVLPTIRAIVTLKIDFFLHHKKLQNLILDFPHLIWYNTSCEVWRHTNPAPSRPSVSISWLLDNAGRVPKRERDRMKIRSLFLLFLENDTFKIVLYCGTNYTKHYSFSIIHDTTF